jgi:hypothetical protein
MMREGHEDGSTFKPTPQELKEILASHRGWLANQPGKDPLPPRDHYLEEVEPVYPDWRSRALSRPERANLSEAELSGANLSGAELSGANLSGASLVGAVLNEARLIDADLRSARLNGAQLIGATLSNSDLSNANLLNAVLSNARLRSADLTQANMFHAILCNANLRYAIVTGTTLAYADLTRATYAPKSAPPDSYVAGILGLSTVAFVPGEEIGLVQLRKLLQDAGLRDLEREATYTIERLRTKSYFQNRRFGRGHSAIEGTFRMVAFDWTTAYGKNPGRAGLLIILLWLLCIPAFSWSVVRPESKDNVGGIYQVFPKDRIVAVPTGHPPAEGISELVTDPDWKSAIPRAAYFSLISATNIGFQQFTPGDWIGRLQSQEYALKAEGWVRSVAGAQSLLSLYLLAIWVLTYFGRPFQ